MKGCTQISLTSGTINNPVAQGLDSYLDVTDKERALFSKIDYERYDTMAFITKEEAYPEASFYVVDNMTPETLGHGMVFYMRWANEPDQPLVSYVLRKHKDPNESVEAYKARSELDYAKTQYASAVQLLDAGKTDEAMFVLFFPYASGIPAKRSWMEAVKWFDRWLWY